MHQNVGDGIGQMLEGIEDRFLAGFAAGDEFYFSKSLQLRRQKFRRPFFFPRRDGKYDFGYAFNFDKFFKGIGQKRLAVNFGKLFGDFAAYAFAFACGDDN